MEIKVENRAEGMCLKCIKSAKIAKQLIQKGYIVRDIKPNRDNENATVFLFEITPSFMQDVKILLDNEERERIRREL